MILGKLYVLGLNIMKPSILFLLFFISMGANSDTIPSLTPIEHAKINCFNNSQIMYNVIHSLRKGVSPNTMLEYVALNSSNTISKIVPPYTDEQTEIIIQINNITDLVEKMIIYGSQENTVISPDAAQIKFYDLCMVSVYSYYGYEENE